VTSQRLAIRLSEGTELDGLLQLPDEHLPPARCGLVLAHGARGGPAAADLQVAAEAALSLGMPVLRFPFPYRQAGRAAPDPLPTLQGSFRAAVAARSAATGLAPEQLVLGGRSLGARVAALAAAAGERAAALLMLAYPLHPAGDPEQLRDVQLYVVRRPMLFVSGTRDELAQPERLKAVAGRLGSQATLAWLEGADHGFRLDSRATEPAPALLPELGSAVRGWLQRLLPRAAR